MTTTSDMQTQPILLPAIPRVALSCAVVRNHDLYPALKYVALHYKEDHWTITTANDLLQAQVRLEPSEAPPLECRELYFDPKAWHSACESDNLVTSASFDPGHRILTVHRQKGQPVVLLPITHSGDFPNLDPLFSMEHDVLFQFKPRFSISTSVLAQLATLFPEQRLQFFTAFPAVIYIPIEARAKNPTVEGLKVVFMPSKA